MELFHLVICTCAELLNDLEHTPEPEHDNQRTCLFETSSQCDIDDEGCNDDGRVEDMEGRFQVSKSVSE